MQFLGCHQREAGVQIEAHLIAKDAQCPGTRPVGFFGAVIADVAQEIEVLTH
jgi:hypothetical protein